MCVAKTSSKWMIHRDLSVKDERFVSQFKQKYFSFFILPIVTAFFILLWFSLKCKSLFYRIRCYILTTFCSMHQGSHKVGDLFATCLNKKTEPPMRSIYILYWMRWRFIYFYCGGVQLSIYIFFKIVFVKIILKSLWLNKYFSFIFYKQF